MLTISNERAESSILPNNIVREITTKLENKFPNLEAEVCKEVVENEDGENFTIINGVNFRYEDITLVTIKLFNYCGQWNIKVENPMNWSSTTRSTRDFDKKGQTKIENSVKRFIKINLDEAKKEHQRRIESTNTSEKLAEVFRSQGFEATSSDYYSCATVTGFGLENEDVWEKGLELTIPPEKLREVLEVLNK